MSVVSIDFQSKKYAKFCDIIEKHDSCSYLVEVCNSKTTCHVAYDDIQDFLPLKTELEAAHLGCVFSPEKTES